MKRSLKNLVIIIVTGVIIYHFRATLVSQLLPIWENVRPYIFSEMPCKKPIPYVLGTFDTEFKISQDYFLRALLEAEAIWEKPAGLNLFIYAPTFSDNHVLKINLIYDYRQQATEKLKSLGIVVKDTRASYDSLKSKYTALQAEYLKEKNVFSQRLQSFDQKNRYYKEQVEYWNKRDGAPQKEFDKIETLHQELEVEAKDLEKFQVQINNMVDEVNALAVVLNRLAESLNITAQKYNTIGASRGESFEEGVYTSDGSEREINIYEFSSREKLVRVLAHELGHALGLEHVEDPKAIMYKLNRGESGALTPSDLALLETKCKIK